MFQVSHLSYVGILQDEIKVSGGLVYDRTCGEFVGFVELDKPGNELLNIGHVLQDTKPKLATTILVVMIRGLSSNLRYPLACFATNGIMADLLYPIIWETVEILEVDCMLVFLYVTCDGASPNRRFFNLHCTNDNFYWTWNPYAKPRRKLYFSLMFHI